MIIAILIINTIVSILVIIYGILTKEEQKSLFIMMGFLCILCPVVMPLFLLIARVAQLFHRDKESDMSEISFDKEREKSVDDSDVGLEMNFTSLTEAQVFSRTKELRLLIMNVLKKRTANIAGALKNVIDHPDTEASHYAAVAIQDELNDFRNQVSGMSYALTQNPDDAALNIELLKRYYEELRMNIFSENEKKQYVYSAVAAAQNLYDKNLWHMLAKHYLWVVELLIEVDGVEEVEKWVDRVKMNRPGELETYKCELRLYHATSQNKKFMACLNEFKRTSITADKDMLDLIRFYQS